MTKVKENSVLENRKKEAIEQAEKVVALTEAAGIPYEFGFIWTYNGAEYTYDKINKVVTVKMGPNYQLVVSLYHEEVTVYCGSTWISFLNTAYDKYVKDKEEIKNPSNHKILKYLGL